MDRRRRRKGKRREEGFELKRRYLMLLLHPYLSVRSDAYIQGNLHNPLVGLEAELKLGRWENASTKARDGRTRTGTAIVAGN